MSNLTDKFQPSYPLSLILGGGFMDGGVPTGLSAFMRWLLAGIVLFCLFLAAVDEVREGHYWNAGYWLLGFLVSAAGLFWWVRHELAQSEAGAVSRPDLRTSSPGPLLPPQSREILLQEAGQIAYEHAEREGWLEKIGPATGGDPQLPVEYFKYAILTEARKPEITLSGKKGLSRNPYSIPSEAVPGLHPMTGENTLHRGHVGGQAEFKDVTISAADLDKVIAIYRAIAVANSSETSKEVQPNPPTMFEVFQSDFAGLTGK